MWQNLVRGVKMKKIIIILAFLLFANPIFAQESILSSCYKTYPISAQDLYMLTLSLLNNTSQYNILEFQSKSGYILFRTASKDYLITISKIGANSSGIKILPANSNFSNGINVQNAIFYSIESNIKNTLKQVI